MTMTNGKIIHKWPDFNVKKARISEPPDVEDHTLMAYQQNSDGDESNEDTLVMRYQPFAARQKRQE